jgi:hypothetical protein
VKTVDIRAIIVLTKDITLLRSFFKDLPNKLISINLVNINSIRVPSRVRGKAT